MIRRLSGKMVRYLVSTYLKLPIKPFRGILAKLYQKYKLLNRNKVVIATVDGITYQLDLNELIDSSIYYEGCFEPMTTAIINKFVKEGMTVLDVGANIGCHTFRFAKLVGETGRVIAFEPISYAFTKLKRNLELNNFNNVTLEKIALSDESKGIQEVEFYASWALTNERLNNVHPIHGGHKFKDVVGLVTIDDYVRRKEIKTVDFIKLDVDGYECKVIRGGYNTIKKFKPVMIIEFGEYTLKEVGDSLENLIDLLDSLGYSFYSEENFKKYGSKESLLNAVPPDSTINVLCKSSMKVKK